MSARLGSRPGARPSPWELRLGARDVLGVQLDTGDVLKRPSRRTQESGEQLVTWEGEKELGMRKLAQESANLHENSRAVLRISGTSSALGCPRRMVEMKNISLLPEVMVSYAFLGVRVINGIKWA